MLKKFRNAFFKPEGLEAAKADGDAEATFEVRYGHALVGTLRHTRGQWVFSYSDGFKQGSGMRPIADFPDVAKRYEEKDLWPFFASRIPSLENPRVRIKLHEENVNATDLVGLLRLFGKRTIANPLELVAVG